ncbi:hypothetical protein [Phytohabitans houttuyneae]|uniref:hypothetical protein n=1 Tax=Phytohabitans houttuyneae TaxID=1076126 RepID=UPI0015675585|nr:hypothetical protein [Phytohabitans houttuyneae]
MDRLVEVWFDSVEPAYGYPLECLAGEAHCPGSGSDGVAGDRDLSEWVLSGEMTPVSQRPASLAVMVLSRTAMFSTAALVERTSTAGRHWPAHKSWIDSLNCR